MTIWKRTLRTGLLATATTTGAMVVGARRDGESPAGVVNSVSHIAFGEEAFEVDVADFKHTATGLFLNSASVIGWSFVQELALGLLKKRSPSAAVVTGVGVAALAMATDYHLVPERLTPGFEQKLSKESVAGLYGVLALTLALGALLPNCDSDEE